VYFRQPINTGFLEGIEEAEDTGVKEREKRKQTSHSLTLNCDFNPRLINI